MLFGAQPPWPAGDWCGVLDLGQRQLGIIYYLETDGRKLEGRMDVPARAPSACRLTRPRSTASAWSSRRRSAAMHSATARSIDFESERPDE
ncbi:MAG: hypothetical protein RQ741_06775 [Wenzhouxiangellaceae bacterium]|nr:hypothetical protein [Wenzhouxiangellaceae bacterium]